MGEKEGTTQDVMDSASELNDIDMNDFTDFEEAASTVKEGIIEDIDEPNKEDKNEKENKKEEPSKEDKDKNSKEDKDNKENKENKDKILDVKNDKDSENEDEKDNEVHEVPVDGKTEKVSLKELKANYSGKVAFDKKFSALGEEKREAKVKQYHYENDKKDLLGKVDAFVDAVSKKDSIASIESLAILANANPIELRKNFIDLVKADVAKYVQMTPEEQKELDNKLESDYNKKRSDYESNAKDDKLEADRLEIKLLTLQKDSGIDDESLIKCFDSIEDKSKLSNDEILVKIQEAFKSGQIQDKASKLLTELDPSLVEDNDLLEEVRAITKKNPEFSNDDIKEIVSSILEDGKADENEDNSSDKLQKKISKKTSKKQAVESDDDLDDCIDFDSIGI